MKLSQWLFGLVLAWSAQAVLAVPVSGSDRSGPIGSTVGAALIDGDGNGPAALWFQVDFDPMFLSFNRVDSGSLFSAVPVTVDDTDIGSGKLTIIVSSPDNDLVNAGLGTLIEVMFDILNTVTPGDFTEVTFTCLDDDGASTTDSAFCADYKFGQTVATITALERTTPMPLPGSLPLVLLGIAGLVAARRRG